MSVATRSLRVVLYGRVSLDPDGRSKSVDDQLAELERWAHREGWTIAATFRDDGISASRFSSRGRSGWASAMDELANGSIDALLVWEISRASRDRPVFAALFAACVDAGVRIGTNGRLFDLADAEDGFVLDLGAALAVREAALLSRRVRRAVESRAAAGRPAGSVPFGYRRVLEPHTGRVLGRELHPDQAPVVAEIVRRLLAREPADAIAADLNSRGIPTGTGDRWLGRHLRAAVRAEPEHPISVEIARRLQAGETPKEIAEDLNDREVPKVVPARWRGGNLAKLALRPTYAGLRTHHGAVLDGVKATWPPIITEIDHHRLVEMFSEPQRDRFRNPTHVRNLGSGLYLCGREDCHGRMRVVVQGGGRPRRYDCAVCHRVSRHQEPVDNLVESLLVGYRLPGGEWVPGRLSRPDVLEMLAKAAGDDTTTADAAAEATRLRQKLQAARQAWDEDRMSLESFTDMEARTLPKIRAAEEAARPKSLPDVVYQVAGPDAEAQWAALSMADKRALVAALVDVVILPVGRGHWRWDPTSVAIRWRGHITSQQ